MASAIAGGLVAVAREVWGLIYPKIKSTVNFRSNLETLRKETANLINLGTHVKEQIDVAERSGNVPTPAVIRWIQEFEDIKNKMGSVEESLEVNNNKCYHFCYSRCALDAAVTKSLEDVKRLIEAGGFPSGMVIENYQVKKVEHIPAPSITGQGTASTNLTKVLTLLGDENASRIGIWGMGGVGKTTLVKNLNNELETANINDASSSTSSQCFGVVIWVTVSKELDLRRLQTQFLERLNLEVKAGESMERTASRLHHRLKQEERFVLILDDVWEVIDLDDLGVPQSEFHNRYKVILTSRSLDVCRQMKTDVDVKVDVLNEEESWQLFTKNVGSVASLQHIEPIAREVSKECGGLPLAITTVGASMRGRTMVALWKDSLNTLQTSTPRIPGIREKVYRPLKWSFDTLNFEGTEIKSCLLYCSLYPENFSIRVRELVQCLIAEGLVVELQNYESSTIAGITLVEYLKASSLLEDGTFLATVKMHDVVRDVAMWIASSLDGHKSLVRSGIDLNQILEDEFSEDLDRISLAYNKITSLPDCLVQCPKVKSLLLQGNRRLPVVPERFLLGFPSLKVLNLSETRINRLPSSLFQLGELQALLLRGCQNLVELPPLGGLQSLQVLDCSLTCIEELPEGMENLANLRWLDLSGTRRLRHIRSGIISQLSRIEIIDMTNSFYKWGGKGAREKGRSPFNELRCLDRLSALYIHLDVSCLAIKDLAWIGRVKRVHLIIGHINVKIVGREKPDEKKVTLSDEGIKWLVEYASKQLLEGKTPADPLKGHCFSVLKSLTISDCRCNFPPATGDSAQFDLLPNLEELVLGFVIYPDPISELVHHLGLRFSKLRTMRVVKCFYLEYLLSSSGSVPTFKNLEEITISSCERFVDIFDKSRPSHSSKEIVEPAAPSIQPLIPSCVVPNLRILKLENLPRLVRQNESWLDLELHKVIKLPLQRNQ